MGGPPGMDGTDDTGFLVIPGLIILLPRDGQDPTSGGDATPGTDAPGGQGGPGGSGNPGVNLLTDNIEAEYDPGFIGGITAGRLFSNGLRAELELRYSQNDFDQANGSVEGMNVSGNVSGDISSSAAMANLFYDFNRAGRLHPYIGLGAGVAQVEVNDFGGGNLNGDDIVFAYQGGAGLAFDITDRLTVDLGYRYFATDDPSFSVSGNNVRTDFEFEYAQRGALVSLRYLFAPTSRADSDGDGVPDILDKCPNTPAGAPVDANGCPLDSDGEHGIAPIFAAMSGTGEQEVNEQEVPFLRLVSKKILKDNQAFGKYRGGMGYEMMVASKDSEFWGFMVTCLSSKFSITQDLFGGCVCPTYRLCKVKGDDIY